jgi:hypothetical protein
VSISERLLRISRLCPMPAVFNSTIRDDIVQLVHGNITKNRSKLMEFSVKLVTNSAESWVASRAIACILRIGVQAPKDQGCFR